jgi:hypothetical protein
MRSCIADDRTLLCHWCDNLKSNSNKKALNYELWHVSYRGRQSSELEVMVGSNSTGGASDTPA